MERTWEVDLAYDLPLICPQEARCSEHELATEVGEQILKEVEKRYVSKERVEKTLKKAMAMNAAMDAAAAVYLLRELLEEKK